MLTPRFLKIVRDIVIASVYPSKRSFVPSGSALFVDVSYMAIVGKPAVTLVEFWMFFSCFCLLLYVVSQQLWSWRDGQFT